MKLCRYWSPRDHMARIGAVDGDEVYDLSAVRPDNPGSFSAVLELDDLPGIVHSAARADSDSPALRFSDLDITPDPAAPHLLAPISHQEVWGTGETYIRDASDAPDASPFDRAYHADRPELFFKATPHRVVGPNGAIRARADAALTFPEPELALVLNSKQQLVGFTIAHDVTAYSLCDENILYMPQVKVFNGCCALGPAMILASDVEDYREVTIAMGITRDGTKIFEDGTSLRKMRRSFADLTAYLFREQEFPDGVILMSGLGFDLPRGFTIREGDAVETTISGIGSLRNAVR